MTEQKWAYTNSGRTHNHDIWDWHEAMDGRGTNLNRNVRQSILPDLGKAIPAVDTHKGGTFLAFDGQQWISGNVALPKNISPEKFGEHYSFDKVGRRTHWMHGFLSNDANFPSELPHVDSQAYIELHESFAKPIADKSFDNPSQYTFSSSHQERVTKTEYTNNRFTKPISEVLPPDAIEHLKQAHASGQPTAIHFDKENGAWGVLHYFKERIAADEKRAELLSQPQTKEPNFFSQHTGNASGVPITPTSQSHIPTPTTSSHIPPVGASHVPPSPQKPSAGGMGAGKIALISGGVIVGATLGYWAFKTLRERSQRAAQQKQPTGHAI